MADLCRGLWYYWGGLWANTKTFFSVTEGATYYISIILMLIGMLMKTVVNKRVTFLDFKQCVIEMPLEILLLSLGFAVSNLGDLKKNEDIINLFIIWICLFIDAAVINWIKDRMEYFNTGRFGITIVITYVLAVVCVIFSVKK